MQIKPVFTEKSLAQARVGKYSFWVDRNATKPELKSIISKMFGVHITGIKTISVKGESKRNSKGRKIETSNRKKAIVTLLDKEKIDLFEESKK